ncbi:helix-turn-helix transcriptional regulator [Vogesella indigofera]|uniref:WYL domain-containing protein n=1 Tax=Vogesella indigofera TaxID=45465 RepID=A0ABT5I2I1_VOGIN|nr:WYL domain-containing protein [Vogesella indigofera]MDC7690379.1 WYL domain-containing protein [Vogesella indigofera]
MERLNLIFELLPSNRSGSARGLTIAELEAKLGDQSEIEIPHRRSLQRDLQVLVREDRVVVLGTAKGDLPRYQRVEEPFEIEEPVWNYLLQHLKRDLEGMVSAGQLSKILNRLKLKDEGLDLGEDKICILPDSLRLQPAQIDYQVFANVLRALADGAALRVRYIDRLGKASEPVLHPLGVMQRGPRVYLCAMKNDEQDERMYALDRMRSAECLPISARQKSDFDFNRQIAEGRVDFANGQQITLKATVRGYVEQLLYDCPMHDSQKLDPLETEEAGSLLTVTLPASGQLLRWILAGGGNIILMEPETLREVVVGQVKKMYDDYYFNDNS